MKLSSTPIATVLTMTLGISACSPAHSNPATAGSDLAGQVGTSQNQPMVPTQGEGIPAPTQQNTEGSQSQKTSRDVIVQLFNYPFTKITEEMPTLAKIGYGQIHVSPPNLTIASDQWWGRYQPVDYRLIAGPLGNENDFKAMIKSAHDNGLKIIVDIVFNHTANPTSQLPKEAGDLAASQGALFTAADYHPAACIKDYTNVTEVRNNRMCGGAGDVGLPDLDQNSAHVLTVQQDFLKRLNDMGVDGFRFDAVKHMEPAYFAKLLTADIRKDKFIFGEIIADSSAYSRDMAPYMAADAMRFYDFPFRDTMQKAFAFGGILSALVDVSLIENKKLLPSIRSVAFIMNHDLPTNDAFKSMVPDPIDEKLEYAFLLGRADGVPYVYSDLGTKGGGGIPSDRWNHAYANPDLVKMVAFHNAMSGLSQAIIAADDCIVALQRGTKGVIAINKCGETKKFSIASRFATGIQLTNLITNDKITVSASTGDIQIAPRSFLLLTVP